MKKSLKIATLLSLVAATQIFAGGKPLSQADLNNIKTKSAVLNSPAITVEKGEEINGGMYHIKAKAVIPTPQGNKMQPVEAFVDKQSGYTFIGGGYDNKGQKINFSVDKKIVESGVAFEFGKGSKEVYLMTDPECPFCQRFEKELGDKLAAGYKVNVVLYPLNFHHRAKPMTQWVLKGKTQAEKADRMHKVMTGSTEWAKELGFKNWNYDPRDQAAVAKYMEEYKPYMAVLSGQDKNWKKYFDSEAELKNFQDYLSKSERAFMESQAKGTPNIFDKDFNEITPDKI